MCEHQVLRVAALLVVLIFIAGTPAATLCSAWCRPNDVATSGCRHHEQTSSPSIKGIDTCAAAALNAPGFIREDGRRADSSFEAAQAASLLLAWVAPPTNDSRQVEGTGSIRGCSRPERSTVLRL
jgi:hypothetical protein